jgi:hypothetical protein
MARKLQPNSSVASLQEISSTFSLTTKRTWLTKGSTRLLSLPSRNLIFFSLMILLVAYVILDQQQF